MKLKLVVASMSLLGLVSCPVLAQQSYTKHKLHHRQKMMKYHKMAAHHDYKDMGALPVQPAAPIIPVSNTAMIYQRMSQNTGRAMPMPEWYNRIGLSGGINVDMGKWGSRNPRFEGENTQRLSLNDAYLNVVGSINDWTKAFASISYSNPSNNNNTGGTAQYSGVYTANQLSLEQAYLTIANYDVYPIFLKIGKQFQDFGRYEIHPITRSMTQALSETLATSANLGFILPSGFHGSAALFDNLLNTTGALSPQLNGTVSLGYDHINDQLGYDLGIGYLYNMTSVGDVANAIANSTTNGGSGAANVGTPGTTVANMLNATYARKVHAIALYGNVNSGPFTIGADYTTATNRFSNLDISKNNVATGPTAIGAQPWAAGIQAGYGFTAWDKNQNVYLGYQTSRQAVNIFLPKNRWLVGYDIDMWKYTNFGLEWDHDIDYSVSQGGTGNNYNLVSLRAAVKFG